MVTYTVSQAADILGIKMHTIRYWEKHLSYLLVKKDARGRKIYTNQEMYILYRLHFLIHKKGYTLKGASHTLAEELSSKHGSSIRVAFLSLLDKLEKQRSILSQAKKVINDIKHKEEDTSYAP